MPHIAFRITIEGVGNDDQVRDMYAHLCDRVHLGGHTITRTDLEDVTPPAEPLAPPADPGPPGELVTHHVGDTAGPGAGEQSRVG